MRALNLPRRGLLLSGLLFASVLLGLGCDDATTAPAPTSCEPGTAGCACDAADSGAACVDGLMCHAGTCQAPVCDLGSEGCACFADATCRTGADGRPLACQGGLCQVTPCVTGELACPCGVGDACAAGLVCRAGTCADPGCAPGDLGCICDGGACAAGLVCDAGQCVDPGCAPGSAGCLCSDGQCQDGLVCRDARCQAPCPAGRAGCACADGGCDGGLACVADTCVACTAGHPGCVCDADGGCAGDAECLQGVCAARVCPEGTAGCACDGQGGCDAGLACAGTACVPCPAGDLGCACTAGGGCNDAVGLRCTDGRCLPPRCAPGTEGCGCAVGGACGLNDRDEPLSCQDGLCVATSCVPGATGCPCAWGEACTDGGDVCGDGFCRPRGCAAGQLDCRCNGGACDGGLVCRAGAVCTDGTGFVGGVCAPDGTCAGDAVCRDGRCQACAPGRLGCACDGDACAAGLVCEAQVCVPGEVPPDRLAPPEDPRCYTPCTESFEDADGVFRRCPKDGLMGGCVGDRACVAGTCLQPGDAPAACQADYQCPHWQVCIQGQCYSNCERTADCAPGYGCFDKACRRPCAVGAGDAQGACDAGEYCLSVDGEVGACRALVPAEAPAAVDESPVAPLAVSVAHLDFDNTAPSRQLRLDNTTDRPLTVTVRKRSHRLFGAGGAGGAVVDDPDDDVACDPARDCPLTWLLLGVPGGNARALQALAVVVPAQGSAFVELSAAGAVAAPRWEGVLEITHPTLLRARVGLAYTQVPEGHWAGNVYYFGQFGAQGVAEWMALPNPPAGSAPQAWAGSRDDATVVDGIGNAFLQRWSAFRRGRITFEELEAVLTALTTESWRSPSVSGVGSGCPTAVCYPYGVNRLGLREFSADPVNVPVPGGIVELPFALTLRQPDPAQPTVMSGRIDAGTALHYAGDAAVDVLFTDDPASCSRVLGDTCVTFLEDLSATVALGGRYVALPGAGCAAPFEPVQIPWLLEGFQRGTAMDADRGLRVRTECRDPGLPFQRGLDAAAEAAANRALTAANPVPDGRPRRRSLSLVDGALLNQQTLLIIFEERFESFLDPEADTAGFASYGVALLKRHPHELDQTDADGDAVPDVYQGATPDTDRPEPAGALAVACDAALVSEAVGAPAVTAGNAAALLTALIDGGVPAQDVDVLTAQSAEQPHYLCVDTGLFDGGPENASPHGARLPALSDACGRVNGVCEDGGDAAVADRADLPIRCPLGTDTTDCGPRFADAADNRVPCPAGSEVLYFTVDADALSQADIAALPCQQDGTCAATLVQWRATPGVLIQPEARWRCADSTRAYCSDDRANLRLGKQFFAQAEARAVFTPLRPAIDQAFRYKTRFRDREGRDLGFAPDDCSGGGAYCYDPAAIEALRARADCLIDVRERFAGALDAATRTRVDAYLAEHFAFTLEPRGEGRAPLVHDGFERLYAELLVVLGDEALTRAFASRFDLAGLNAAAFPGATLEVGGLDLAGQAGHELRNLYRATQAYGEALDRFYALSPTLYQWLQGERGIVTQDTVVWYFDRLVRASSKRARAWAEIARRYQGFNRPDLAKAVVERAYASGYLESVVMSRLMLRVVDAVAAEDRLQIRALVEDAQGRYRVALGEMRAVYRELGAQQTVFGLAPDFIPIPALDAGDFRQSNAFEVMRARAEAKLQLAREREDAAINATRDFDLDQARFQGELARLQRSYDDRLAALCGTFTGDDGAVYPATARYADRSAQALALGDPCGLVGHGTLHDATVDVELRALELKQAVGQIETTLATVEIERQRIGAQCGLVFSLADFQYERAGQRIALEEDIRLLRFAMGRADRLLGHINANLGFAQAALSCRPQPFCAVNNAKKAVLYNVAAAVVEAGTGVGEIAIELKTRRIAELERERARWQTRSQCDQLAVDGNARMADLLVRLDELELALLKAEYGVQKALGDLQAERARARRLAQQRLEAEQLQLNAEVARNDPNQRLYRNDAVLNADLSFDDAIREVYAMTRVFEYYTSQSYADRERLFFIRLVGRGADNLENYVTDLNNAFFEFEENFGVPDTRVQVISLRDDILAVPYVGEDGAPLSSAQRTARLHAALRDPAWLDANGYLSLPFSTSLADLSPVTRNHKVLGVEAEIIASDFGDHEGRLYLEQSGTGVIRGVDGGVQSLRLPARTAVLNPFFNGSRFFDAAIYRNGRLRDRPLVNTAWSLKINTRSEQANADLDLQSLTDIRLFVYYSDFTAEL